MFHHGILHKKYKFKYYITCKSFSLIFMSMEIVGVESTDKRAVKCFDLIKTNKSESI